MNKKRIDLSDIKENDFDKTSSFTDLMSKSERRKRNIEKENINNYDIKEIIKEKKKFSEERKKELEKTKRLDNYFKEEKEDSLGKTQILELTRQMKFNFEENKIENNKKKKKGFSSLNIIGEINLLCIGYYIYLLTFTNYQDNENNYLITGSMIVLLVLLFGISVITNKKISKLFNILNILVIIVFIIFNIYTLSY